MEMLNLSPGRCYLCEFSNGAVVRFRCVDKLDDEPVVEAPIGSGNRHPFPGVLIGHPGLREIDCPLGLDE